MFALAESGKVELQVSALSFSNLYYIIRKQHGHSNALQSLEQLRKLVRVVSVGTLEVDQALAASFGDFEDALQFFAARTVPDVSCIVTRDKKGFANSILRIFTAEEFLEEFANAERSSD